MLTGGARPGCLLCFQLPFLETPGFRLCTSKLLQWDLISQTAEQFDSVLQVTWPSCLNQVDTLEVALQTIIGGLFQSVSHKFGDKQEKRSQICA